MQNVSASSSLAKFEPMTIFLSGDILIHVVIGTFTVPTSSGPTGASAAAWVGIDGVTCDTVILQTGVAFTVKNSQPKYNAWYEWYTAPSYDFSGITISAGDVIKLTVTASSETSGTAEIENLFNGQTASKSLTSSTPLCRQNAEWVVEDYAVNNSAVPFADFGTVTFTNAEATGTGTYTPSGAGDPVCH
ncbi:hypothetical protein OG21DRAFT_1601614 [Imleria badia]|nr:hypothetical protein OG21DRAFT_1601614 [Imleria badia]